MRRGGASRRMKLGGDDGIEKARKGCVSKRWKEGYLDD